MNKHFGFSVIVALALSASGVTAYADRGDTDLRARLSGLNEVPPTASRGSAELKAEISGDRSSITFTLEYADLSGAPAAAHIHFGQTKVNGGVMVFFCGGGGKPACPAATSGVVTGTISAADVVGPAAQGIAAGDFEDVIRAIVTGNAYANIHTATFPGGEVRGQVRAFKFHGRQDRD